VVLVPCSSGFSANKNPLGPKAREGDGEHRWRSPLRKEQTLDTQNLSHGLTSVSGRAAGVNVSRPVLRETAPVKFLRRGVVVGLLAGFAYAVWRALAARTPDTAGVTFQTQPFLSPPRPIPRVPTPDTALVPEPADPATPPANRALVPPQAPAPGAAWVEPDAGECPASHPVKAKLGSGIFHVPGGGSYERTKADRCYLDAASAESDGLRPATR